MIYFSKKTTLLKDIIGDNFVDIHSHLLPNIDDGAQNINETLLLINQLREIGFAKMITTPHIIANVWNNTPEIITAKYRETNQILVQKNQEIPLKFAAEYMMDSNFMEKLQSGEKLLTLKENYLLVEMSYLNPPIQLLDIVFEIQVAGYIPILAHPERYTFYYKKYEALQQLKNAGCKFQLNLLSTVGYYGPVVAEMAKYILSKGWIDFVGSDTHHEKHTLSFNKKLLLKDLNPLKEAISNNQYFTF